MADLIAGRWGRQTQTAQVEELLRKNRWTDEEFKVLTDFLTFKDDDRKQALHAVPIENLLAAMGVPFSTGKQTPQVACFLPGHTERTASMTLYRRSNSCYCFGCRRSLNPIDLVVQFYGKSYSEALDYLLGECLRLPTQLLRRRVKAHFEELRCKRQKEAGLPALRPDQRLHLGRDELRFMSNKGAHAHAHVQVQVQGECDLRAGRENPQLPSLAPVGILSLAGHNKARSEGDPTLTIARRTEEVAAVLAASAEFYHLMLTGYARATTYLKERGLSEATINRHRLGYAGGIGLRAWLRTHGLDPALATLLGLLGRDGHAENLSGRVILPVYNRAGRVVQISGRYLSHQSEVLDWFNQDTGEDAAENEHSGVESGGKRSKQPPKYLHLRWPKPSFEGFLPPPPPPPPPPPTGEAGETHKVERVLLVEGVFDYLIALGWGYQALPAFGTNIGSENVGLLKAWVAQSRLNQLLICFDNDPDKTLPDGTTQPGAGPQATTHLLAALDSPQVWPVHLPSGVKDIGSLAQMPDGEGQALLTRAIEQALSFSFRHALPAK